MNNIKIKDCYVEGDYYYYYWVDKLTKESIHYQLPKDIANCHNRKELVDQMYDTVTKQLILRRKSNV